MDYSLYAHLYDSVVRFEDDLPFFVEECRNSPGPLLELMAGTGRVTTALVASGLRPTCVDSSPNMLAHLMRKLGARQPEVVCADVKALPFAGHFTLAILPFNSFSELVSEEARHAALHSIHAALTPRARFICTLHNPAVRLKSVSPEPQILSCLPSPSGRGEVVLTIESEYDEERGVVSGVQAITRRDAGGVREEVSVPLEFCLPSASWFSRGACSAGFGVEALFGDYDRSEYDEENSRFMIWCLGKGSG